MEPVTLLIVLALVVAAGVGVGLAFYTARRRGGSGVPLEPPPEQREVAGVPDEVKKEVAEHRAALEARLDEQEAAGSVEEVEEELRRSVDEAMLTAEAESEALDHGAAPEDVLEPPEGPTAGAAVEEEAPAGKPRFRDRLAKARDRLAGMLGGLAGRGKIDADTWDDVEEALISADMGIDASLELVEHLKERAAEEGITDGDALLAALKTELKDRLGDADRGLATSAEKPTIWLFVGVNGVGKTTTIGKLGRREAQEGRSVVMAAGDTFRAAAAEQLGMWAERAGAEIVRGAEGGDPSSVIFDAVESAAARGADLVLADTAGRLHTKTNLMEELRKVRRVADKGAGAVTEVLLVIDATTGQNGLVQAKQFTEAAAVTGVVLTKLDGSAKGGIVYAIQHDLGIPVKLVGLGEGVDDLVEFDPDEFVEALFT